MSAELNGSSRTPLSPTPRELAATLFRRPRLVATSFGVVLLATMLLVVFSARYESHFKVLLRRGRYDPVVSSQPASPMDFTRPDITEEELNSEVELLSDEDLLKQVVKMAGLLPADTPEIDRPAEIEHAVHKLMRRLDVEAVKKSNLIQVSYKDTSPERAARILAALSTLYVRRHTNLQRPPGEIEFFNQRTAEYEKRLHQSEAELVHFTRVRGVASASLERDIALQKLGDADAAYRQIDQDRVETEHRIKSLGEQLKSFPSRSVTLKRWADNPEVLEKMKTHLLELQLKHTELLSRFEPSYRLVREVEQEIAETQSKPSKREMSGRRSPPRHRRLVSPHARPAKGADQAAGVAAARPRRDRALPQARSRLAATNQRHAAQGGTVAEKSLNARRHAASSSSAAATAS